MRKLIIICILLFNVVTSYSEMTVVKIFEKEAENDVRHDYFVGLLDLALEKTEAEYGKYMITFVDISATQSRLLLEVQRGRKIDLIWSMTSKEREEGLNPIRVPLVKGLWGHRIFIIRKEDKKRFNNIKNLRQLNYFKAGQGHDWPDTEILEANGINIITSAKYVNLFNMLGSGRFDYFPRGLSEPWPEVKNYGNGRFLVDEKLMFRYKAPMYYFVNKDNHILAERIEKGLRIAIKDGSFDEYFYNHPQIIRALELSDISNRIVFDLRNPLLTKETKAITNIDEFWYEVGDEIRYRAKQK